MKLLIFQKHRSQVSIDGYRNAIKIGYFLNEKLVSIGIDEGAYYTTPDLRKASVDFKIKILLENLEDDERELVSKSAQQLKNFKTIKNKSGKMIVAVNQLKKTIETCFEDGYLRRAILVDSILGIDKMRNLLETDVFYFYAHNEESLIDPNTTLVKDTDILQLLLPDSTNDRALFFLNIETMDGKNFLPDLRFHAPDAPEAQDLNSLYCDQGFVFPNLDLLSTTEILAVRNQLSEPTSEFREKLNQWIAVCYDNPNTTKGLEFFKENLSPYLKSISNIAFQSSILKNTAGLTNNINQTSFTIGEVPIDKIWEIYKDSNTITQETYDELMLLKENQYPKLEGRWPVLCYKSIPNKEFETEIPVLSARKTISLD